MTTPAILSTADLTSKLEQVLLKGDLSSLSDEERLTYYRKVCESVGLNYLTQPFSYLFLSQKLVLYANKSGTDQLRKIHKISIYVTAREKIGDVYVVTARAKGPDSREDESTGAISIGRAQGDALANLYMKAETKAKRRVTLSICGLGMLDESEVDTIPTAVKPEAHPTQAPQLSVRLDSHEGGEYRIPFGKFKNKTLGEVDPDELRSYCKYIRDAAEVKEEELKGSVLEFLERAESHLGELFPSMAPTEDFPF